MNAQIIRDALSILFGSRRIEDLKAELAEARKERDYFRGRADRLELMILTPFAPRPDGPPMPLGPAAGRKSWSQVQSEAIEQQRKEAEDKKAKAGN